MMYKILVLCAFFASAWAACKNPTPLATFTVSKAVGSWIIQKEYGTGLLSALLSCPGIVYTDAGAKKIKIKLTGSYAGMTYSTTLDGTEITTGKYSVSGNQPVIGSVKFNITVLTADDNYTKFMVGYGCNDLITPEISIAYVHLRDKSVTLTPDDQSRIDAALQSVGYSSSSSATGCGASSVPSFG